jgi:aspartate kinase
MSSVLFSYALKTVLKNRGSSVHVSLLDVREIMLTDDQFGKARPQIEKIAKRAEGLSHSLRNDKKVYVTQGFIGMTEEGLTTTLGRGGSDYSAALLAEAVSADVLEIWTDVAGIATTDPRLVPEAKPIDEISFKEASELAVFGAKVLHPATLLPAMRKNIPTFVGSSFEAKAQGTWIRREVNNHPLIRALALRRKQALVTVSTPEMLNAYGFLFQIFKIFNDHQVSIDAITTSEISVSVTLDESTLANKALLKDLEKIAEVTVEDQLCLISLIGNNINHTPGLAKKIFDSIPEINVRMICLGASKHNFCFLVSENQGQEALKKLHRNFLQS